MAHDQAPESQPHACILADHAIVRTALHRCITDACATGVAEAASIREALRRLRQVPVWLTMVHLDAGDRSALEAVARLRTREPRMKIVVFIGRPELRCAAQLRRLQPDGYLSKTSEVADIVQALRAIRAGRRWCSPELAPFAPAASIGNEPHHHLTPHEFLVFVELARGRDPARIGATLSLGLARIAQSRARILEKLRASTDAALTHYALRHDLID
jgi:two-component system invasion response regulator UvrY